MSIDPNQIELTPEQKERLAQIAEQAGRDYHEVVDDLIASASAAMPILENGESRAANLYEALDTIGAIGCFDGPADLSTNPTHMEGYHRLPSSSPSVSSTHSWVNPP